MNKSDLARKILSLDDLNKEEKAELLKLIRGHKKYGLVWEDKSEDIEERLREELPVLVERNDEKVHPIISANPTATNHLIIEGDNLAALAELSYTHEGKIDVIYIDPPYNTGNQDFIYNDSFVDSEDSYRHSKWLSFMSRRLRIAKKLLSDRGVIFISIDDNELHNLKLLLDDKEKGLFGEDNFIAQFIWQQGKKSSGNLVGINQEYILCYAKNRKAIDTPITAWKTKKQGLDKIYAKYKELRHKFGSENEKIQKAIRVFYSSLLENDPAYSSKHYNYVDDKGLFFADNSCAPDRPESRCHKPLIHPITKKHTAVPRLGWRWKEETLDKLVAENRIYFGENETTVPKIKKYLTDMEYELPTTVFYKDGRGASAELDAMFGKKVFNNPKDRFVIANLLNYRYNAIILDFFAGSGTTLHAVMQLNAEDGGHRQCILCTNNENGICENVTYQRNKRVIEGYTKPNGQFVEGLPDNNLRYYRTEFLPRSRSRKNRHEFMVKSTNLLCIKENLYTEKEIFGSIKLKSKAARYFADLEKQMLVIYIPEFIPYFVEEIEKMEVDQPIKIYVYSPSRYAYNDEFATVAEKVSLCALPESILEVMDRVLPDKAKTNETDSIQPDAIQEIEKNGFANGLFDEFYSLES